MKLKLWAILTSYLVAFEGCLTECEYFLKREGVLILCLVRFKHRSVTFVYLSIICVRDIFEMKRSNFKIQQQHTQSSTLLLLLTDCDDLTSASNFDKPADLEFCIRQ